MIFGLNLPRTALPRIEDDVRSFVDQLRVPSLPDNDPFDSDLIAGLLARNGLQGNLDLRNLNDLVELGARLPGNLAGPDSTGEVQTGSAAIGRQEAAQAALLAATPRIVEALGGNAQGIGLLGLNFAVAEAYRDPQTGFSALRLVAPDGTQVFSIDGLQVGSVPDQLTAVTLGRLQIESAEFRELVADAAGFDLAGGGVLFTGPSLGGAIAQVAAYETAEAVLAAGGARDAAIRLVTVDALGGRDAAEAINGGRLDGAALGQITALNLRTEGDLVSRIGSHIGATLTLPALDAAGQRVALDAAEAHVNVISLLQVLGNDALFASGVRGAPAEISGFAAVANPAAGNLIEAWRMADAEDEAVPASLQFPGRATFDSTRTLWSSDADENGSFDLSVRLFAPADAAAVDRVLG